MWGKMVESRSGCAREKVLDKKREKYRDIETEVPYRSKGRSFAAKGKITAVPF